MQEDAGMSSLEAGCQAMAMGGDSNLVVYRVLNVISRGVIEEAESDSVLWVACASVSASVFAGNAPL